MENASKALIMAASVLIGIMILSLAVYLFVSFGTTSAEMHKQIEQDNINQFNIQFTIYEGKEVDIYDVITVANLATDNNKNYDFETRTEEAKKSDMFIQVDYKLQGQLTKRIENLSNNDYNKMISNDLSSVTTTKDENGNDILQKNKYKCKVDISDITGKVYKVTFTQIT